MRKLPISIQTFSEIITKGMVYVDKTEHIFRLVSEGKYYFLSRPRRFGKSLLLNTIKSFFSGERELFRGLYIYEKEQNWSEFPVIHIDYSLIDYKSSSALFKESFLSHLDSIARQYDLYLENRIIANAFTELVHKLYEKYSLGVVVLVDEYDKPLVDTLMEESRFNENREILKSLYSAMKGLDAYLRFVILTGVSRFAKVGVFSGMNNLQDISLNETYSTIVGFTQEELENYFDKHLKTLADRFFNSTCRPDASNSGVV